MYLERDSLCEYIGTSVFFFKQMTAYGMHISDWSSFVYSSDLVDVHADARPRPGIGPAATAADTAHVDDGKALRAIAATVVLKGHAGQILHVVLEVLDEIGRAVCRDRGCQLV